LQVGVDTHVRISDEEAAQRLAAGIAKNKMRFPPLKRLARLTQTAPITFCRGEEYSVAKKRLIRIYLGLEQIHRDTAVEAAMRAELERLDGNPSIETRPAQAVPLRTRDEAIAVNAEFIAAVRELRGRGEEEQRQLVAQFFVEILGYRRTRVRSEHERNDVRVYDRRDRPWIIVEVKPSLESDRHRKAARRQGFDYAHRVGVRFVVLSDGDNFEVYDRSAGQRLSYDEMRQGNFRLTALRSRDNDLLGLLASEC
jgi:hypothetical protein